MADINTLKRLARLYNIQGSYHNIFGQYVEPPKEAILSVLRTLGAPVHSTDDLTVALRQRQQELWQQVISPVVVVWNSAPLRLKIRIPATLATTPVHYEIELENGQRIGGNLAEVPGSRIRQRQVEGMDYVVRSLTAEAPLPHGYHRLYLDIGRLEVESYLFVAPSESHGSEFTAGNKSWGLFCPVYALGSDANWGSGDFTDLANLLAFAGESGADAVGTLPLFAAFLDEPYNPSPYSPVSRLFWNEYYLDINRIAELQHCIAARSLMNSATFQADLKTVRAAKLVDYRRTMRLKRKVLFELLNCLFKRRSDRFKQFEQFVATHPAAEDYAAFRAKTDGERKSWLQWSEPSRSGRLRADDYLQQIKQYHLYVQWQAHEQMETVADKARAGGPQLYLDFPLGVNRDGYDVWRERDVFALDASGGAPPDGFFTKGQNWGFPPLHPEGLRRQGYRYYIQALRHQLRYAKMLRIDHVMGLYRFYWVPDGFAPTDGVYVHYPHEEFFAVLALESQRHQAVIVGENLGTVPPAINDALTKHKILGMNVGQFGVTANPDNALDPVPQHVVASLNTHDTPTFASFWHGNDIDDRKELGLLSDEQARDESAGREHQRAALAAYLRKLGLLAGESADTAAVLRAWLTQLAAGDAAMLLVNLEDLWLETLPQNVPGTWEERPNWQRKTRYNLDQLRTLPELAEILSTIHRLRKHNHEANS